MGCAKLTWRTYGAMIAASVAAAAVLVGSSDAAAYPELKLGLVDPTVFTAAHEDPNGMIMNRFGATDSAMLRVNVLWRSLVADAGSAQKPAGFDTRNPADPHYGWGEIDAVVRTMNARGVEPIFTVLSAPNWAEGDDAQDRAHRRGEYGTYNPNADELGAFAEALARRYSGTFPDPANPGSTLPRVRYFQAWNEPNFHQHLTPRTRNGAPLHYVRMLNAFYRGVKAANPSDVVVVGGPGPYGFNGANTDLDPQVFMRAVLCLSGRGGRHLKRLPHCRGRIPYFDVWDQHPYAVDGTPTSPGRSPDAGTLGNMPAIRRTLDKASAAGLVRPRGRKPLWATEIGWFTKPPGAPTGDGRDLGLPFPTQARYLSEAAYRLWRLRVPVMIWYGIRDYPDWPGGLYLSGETPAQDKAKPALTAFRFPFYARRSGRRLLVWGLVHRAGTTTVAVERRNGRRWRRVARVRSDARGTFYARLRGARRGDYRARALDGAKRGLESYDFVVR